MTDAEIERLASRLAMLVSDDGESDNAGRAVGALARRLGLSGGQLKAIFMAGAESAGSQAVMVADQASQIERLRGELAAQGEALRRAEAAARSLQRERDALRSEAAGLQDALDGRRTNRQVRVALGLVVVVALGGAGWLTVAGPRLHLFDASQQVSGTPFYRSALVRDTGTVMRHDPDTASPAVATLTAGTHLLVRRVLWHNLMQWVEVDLGDQTGYVLSTDLELS